MLSEMRQRIYHMLHSIAMTEVTEDFKSNEVLKRYILSTHNEYGFTDDEISIEIHFVTDCGSNFKAIANIKLFNCRAHPFNNVVQGKTNR